MNRSLAEHREASAVERVFREVYGQAVATLVRVFGNISLAEDAVQDAFVAASDRWRRDGIPPNPAGWIVRTAQNRAIDGLRRSARGRELQARDQDRARWDGAMIEEGQAIVRACIRRGQPGPFQIQAAIQAVHCDADTFEATDWPQIVALYDQLLSLMPTPVVALNRAIAIGEIEGPGAALTALDAIASDLDNYHLLHAAAGETLRRLGQRDAARAAFERAASFAASASDRRFLADQIEALAEDGARVPHRRAGSPGPSSVAGGR